MTSSTTKDLKLLLCTANIGNAEPTMESLKAWIPSRGSCSSLTALDGGGADALLSSGGDFDMIVIGMQESTWKKGKAKSSSEDDDESVNAALDTSSHHSSSGGPPQRLNSQASVTSILEGTDAPDTIQLKTMLQETLGDGYMLLAGQQRGQMRLLIWIKKELSKEIGEQDVTIRCENTGIGHVLANKGGIVMTVTYRQTRITFLSAHLAAHEGQSYYDARCDNLREILRGAKTFDKYDAAISSHHMFVMGDLNFRTKFGPYGSMEHEESVAKALDLVKSGDFETLYSFDELHKGVENGDLLLGFETLPCHFSPTFKVLRQDGFVYKEQRTPSYADRILFKSAEGLASSLTPLAYEPCPHFITSDHKPIRGAFLLSLNDTIDAATEDDTKTYHMVFSNMSCEGLPVMDVDGSSDPYIRFVWDSVDMSSDGESGKTKVGLLGQKSQWPSTKMKPKELNPVWEEEIGLYVNTPVSVSGMLFMTVMDYDATSQDDLMCTLPLNVKQLLRVAGQNPNKITQERPLVKYGKQFGSIRYTLTVKEVEYRGDAPKGSKAKKGLFGMAKKAFAGVVPGR